MSTLITVITGDGIGPEITESVLAILKAADCPLEFQFCDCGEKVLSLGEGPLPKSALDIIKRNTIAIKGPIMTPLGKGFRSVNVTLRQNFDLYANVRPIKSLPGVPSRYEDVDLVIYRENTQGLYSGLETFDPVHQMADSTARITRKASLSIINAAFKGAQKRERKKVTLAHKANILKASQGLFLEIGREVARDYPHVQFEEIIIDNMAMQLVLNPCQFDVIVTTNLFGDIISDLCAGLVGGLGFAPGANIGHDIAIFEAVHGSAPDIAGQGVANPTALLLSAIMMLKYLDLDSHAKKIENALFSVYKEGKTRTREIGGTAGTADFTGAVIAKL